MPHRTAQRIDLADDLPLGHTADGRIAAHLGHRIQIGREQRHVGTHPRSGQRRLGSGMPGTDHDHVVLVPRRSHRLIVADEQGREKAGGW